jgi:3-deoxy-D-manno-octulosonic-acid transferase
LLGIAWVLRPAWREGLGERLGAMPPARGGAIWLHGASVGEARLVARLADAVLERGRPAFASLQTTTGRAVLAADRPGLPCALAPIDHPWCVERALRRVDPAALVLVETEIWPSWIAATSRRGVPVALVSARISDRAWPRYRAIAPLMRRTLARLTRIGARSARDAERLVDLGASPDRVTVSGDLKWAPPRTESKPDVALTAALAGRTVVVAGSTHPGEEAAAVEALRTLEASHPGVTLVVAPRHVDRAGSVGRTLAAAGRRVRRRTRLGEAPLGDGEVLLLDTLGELRGLYGLARAAFLGGTLVDVGGHDPLEAVHQGCPVVVGPFHADVRETVGLLRAAGAATVVEDAAGLGAAWRAALDAGAARSEAAVSEVRARGERVRAASLELIEQAIEEGRG